MHMHRCITSLCMQVGVFGTRDAHTWRMRLRSSAAAFCWNTASGVSVPQQRCRTVSAITWAPGSSAASMAFSTVHGPSCGQFVTRISSSCTGAVCRAAKSCKHHERSTLRTVRIWHRVCAAANRGSVLGSSRSTSALEMSATTSSASLPGRRTRIAARKQACRQWRNRILPSGPSAFASC